MERHKVIIGDKEYAMSKLAPFTANTFILKLSKIIVPVLGAVKGKDVMEMDIKEAVSVLSDTLDQSTITNLIFPMFKASQVASLSDNAKIEDEKSFNAVFTTDNLADFYALIWEVLQYNFANFIGGLGSRFGFQLGDLKETTQTLQKLEG